MFNTVYEVEGISGEFDQRCHILSENLPAHQVQGPDSPYPDHKIIAALGEEISPDYYFIFGTWLTDLQMDELEELYPQFDGRKERIIGLLQRWQRNHTFRIKDPVAHLVQALRGINREDLVHHAQGGCVTIVDQRIVAAHDFPSQPEIAYISDKISAERYPVVGAMLHMKTEEFNSISDKKTATERMIKMLENWHKKTSHVSRAEKQEILCTLLETENILEGFVNMFGMERLSGLPRHVGDLPNPDTQRQKQGSTKQRNISQNRNDDRKSAAQANHNRNLKGKHRTKATVKQKAQHITKPQIIRDTDSNSDEGSFAIGACGGAIETQVNLPNVQLNSVAISSERQTENPEISHSHKGKLHSTCNQIQSSDGSASDISEIIYSSNNPFEDRPNVQNTLHQLLGTVQLPAYQNIQSAEIVQRGDALIQQNEYELLNSDCIRDSQEMPENNCDDDYLQQNSTADLDVEQLPENNFDCFSQAKCLQIRNITMVKPDSQYATAHHQEDLEDFKGNSSQEIITSKEEVSVATKNYQSEEHIQNSESDNAIQDSQLDHSIQNNQSENLIEDNQSDDLTDDNQSDYLSDDNQSDYLIKEKQSVKSIESKQSDDPIQMNQSNDTPSCYSSSQLQCKVASNRAETAVSENLNSDNERSDFFDEFSDCSQTSDGEDSML